VQVTIRYKSFNANMKSNDVFCLPIFQAADLIKFLLNTMFDIISPKFIAKLICSR